MKQFKKKALLISTLLLLTGCCAPFQSESYPFWKTKGVISSNTKDSSVSTGYQYLYVGETATTLSKKITLKEATIYQEYNNYVPASGNHLIVAKLEVTNMMNKPQTIYTMDFPLVWNLDKEELSYTYSLDDTSIDENILYNKKTISNTETITLVYEVSDEDKSPFAIEYQEINEDDSLGNTYYFQVQ